MNADDDVLEHMAALEYRLSLLEMIVLRLGQRFQDTLEVNHLWDGS